MNSVSKSVLDWQLERNILVLACFGAPFQDYTLDTHTHTHTHIYNLYIYNFIFYLYISKSWSAMFVVIVILLSHIINLFLIFSLFFFFFFLFISLLLYNYTFSNIYLLLPFYLPTTLYFNLTISPSLHLPFILTFILPFFLL